MSVVAYGLSIGTDIGDFEWPWTAFRSRYFTEFDSFGGWWLTTQWL